MRLFANQATEAGGAVAFLRGAAHALDFAGVMLDDDDWRGFSADAEAIGSYWEVALESAAGDLDEPGAREEG